MKKMLCLMALVIGVIHPSHSEAWFGKRPEKKNEEQKVSTAGISREDSSPMADTFKETPGILVKSFSPEQEREFLSKILMRNQATEAVRLLKSLMNESLKQAEMREQLLLKDFSYMDHAGYRFDSDRLALYEKRKENMGEDGVVVHLFQDEAEVVVFRELMADRGEALLKAKVLKQIISEQQDIINEVNSNLHADYGIDPDQIYRYERETRSLYVHSLKAEGDL